MLGYLKPLYSLSFWFSLIPLPFTRWFEWIIVIINLALIGVGIFWYFVQRRKESIKEMKLVFRRAGTCAMFAGIVGLLLWFFVWQSIPFLSMRILWLLWLVAFGYWAYAIWKYWKRDLPARFALQTERALQERWLPKRKK